MGCALSHEKDDVDPKKHVENIFPNSEKNVLNFQNETQQTAINEEKEKHLEDREFDTKTKTPDSQNQERVSSSQSKQRRKPFVRDKFDPRVLQKYEVKALIGRGSFSKVKSFSLYLVIIVGKN